MNKKNEAIKAKRRSCKGVVTMNGRITYKQLEQDILNDLLRGIQAIRLSKGA